MNNKYFSWFNAYGAATGFAHQNKQLLAFVAGVQSKDHGTIIMPFKLTERCEITVLNAKTFKT